MKNKVIDKIYNLLLEDTYRGKLNREEKLDYIKGYIVFSTIAMSVIFVIPFVILAIFDNLF